MGPMGGLYKAAFAKLLFPIYESGRRCRRAFEYLAEANAEQWLAPARIAELQWRKLEAPIAHCWHELSYYRQHWGELGIDPTQIQGHADYACLPVLRKADVRANLDRLHAVSGEDA